MEKPRFQIEEGDFSRRSFGKMHFVTLRKRLNCNSAGEAVYSVFCAIILRI